MSGNASQRRLERRRRIRAGEREENLPHYLWSSGFQAFMMARARNSIYVPPPEIKQSVQNSRVSIFTRFLRTFAWIRARRLQRA